MFFAVKNLFKLSKTGNVPEAESIQNYETEFDAEKVQNKEAASDAGKKMNFYTKKVI